VVAVSLVVLVAAWHHRLRRELAGVAVSLGAVPFAVYVATYAKWFAQKGFSPRKFWDFQLTMERSNRTLTAMHSYQSKPFGPWFFKRPALEWLVLRRPVAFFFDSNHGVVHHIVSLGNPGLWWLFLPALVGLWFLATRRGAWAPRVILAFYLVQFLPWLFVGRTLFLYYMTPVVPFMALGLVMVARALPGVLREIGAVVAGLASLVGAAFLMPVWIGYGVSETWWRHLMIFRSWI
jgi:dolichyl-phosphate-mannose--protein O-mannosyl transferase